MAIQWGYCTKCTDAARFKAAGWDYVEESVQGLLQGTLPDAEWKGAETAQASPLPIPSANSLVPATHKITGPSVDAAALKSYMTAVLQRAAKVGMKTVVFGSAGARNYPDGFDRATAKKQILDFLAMAAPIAQQNGVLIVAEPLNKRESNIMNTVAESMEYVKELNHPNFKCLVDSYHFWLDNEPLKNLEAAMPSIKHVHVADRDGRVAPGRSGTSDYKPFFKVLKQGGYDGLISVEAGDTGKTAGDEGKILSFLKSEWNAA